MNPHLPGHLFNIPTQSCCISSDTIPIGPLGPCQNSRIIGASRHQHRIIYIVHNLFLNVLSGILLSTYAIIPRADVHEVPHFYIPNEVPEQDSEAIYYDQNSQLTLDLTMFQNIGLMVYVHQQYCNTSTIGAWWC